METGIMEQAGQEFVPGETDPGGYSPLVLAYIGDAVYEVLIRTKMVNHGNMQVNKMHKKSAGLVNAGTQAAIIRGLKEELTPEELAVFRRGRNAKPATMPKHARISDYRAATGFEALIGYLYLAGREKRLLQLVHDGLKTIGEDHALQRIDN